MTAIGQARSLPALPREGGKRQRDGWRRVVRTGGGQKTLHLTTRQQISTYIINTCDVCDVDVEVVCGCNEQHGANEVTDVRLFRVAFTPGVNYWLAVATKEYFVTPPL